MDDFYEENNEEYEEVEEVVNMTEEEFLKMMDEKSNPLDNCLSMFIEKKENDDQKIISEYCDLSKINQESIENLKKNGYFFVDDFILDQSLCKEVYNGST